MRFESPGAPYPQGIDHLRDVIRQYECTEPEEDQAGIAACVGGQILAVDVFDRPQSHAKLWPRLISGYAADALGRREVAPETGAVERFLFQSGEGEVTSHEGVGLGMDIFLTSEASVGSALVWEASVVHIALFARTENGQGPGPPIASPRHRSRLRRPFHSP